jgi:hypothetical protein
VDIASLSFAQDGASLFCALPNQALGAQVFAEAWYIAPAGCTIAKIGYKAKDTSKPAGWDAPAFVSADTDASGGLISTAATFDDTVRLATPASAKRYVYVYMYSNGTAATPAAGAGRRLSMIAAYGNHGLTLRTISGEPSGVYASDVIANIITRAAPLITVPSGAIEATTFAIPHLVFLDPVTPADAIATVNAYHLYDWGVYNGAFFYRAPDPTRLTWQARLSEGAELDLEGDSGAQVFNGVIVSYTDPLGRRRLAGPPAANWPSSTALADVTDASLVDTSTTNPATANGYTRRWGKLDIGFTTSDAGATALGAVWLAEHSLPQRRGALTITGTVTHPTEGPVPVWRSAPGITSRSRITRRTCRGRSSRPATRTPAARCVHAG